MHSDGQFENIKKPDPGQRFASSYLRFYPPTVTLAPNETRVVKVQLTKTNELKSGEYRSHLYFRAVPKAESREKGKENSKSQGLNISLNPIYGISIANIIQIGEPEVHVSISNLDSERFNNGNPIISMSFNRQGKTSIYGDIRIQHISREGKETEVALIKGFAVYTPGNLRKVRVELKSMRDVDYSSGKLKVTYTSQGNEKTYAEAVMNLRVP